MSRTAGLRTGGGTAPTPNYAVTSSAPRVLRQTPGGQPLVPNPPSRTAKAWSRQRHRPASDGHKRARNARQM